MILLVFIGVLAATRIAIHVVERLQQRRMHEPRAVKLLEAPPQTRPEPGDSRVEHLGELGYKRPPPTASPGPPERRRG